MKVGDTEPVTIRGHQVALATVKEVRDGEVSLVVPATLVVMATRTDLAPEVVPEVEAAGTVILTDQVLKPEAPVEEVQGQAAPVPVVQEPTTTAPVTTPVGEGQVVDNPVVEPITQTVE